MYEAVTLGRPGKWERPTGMQGKIAEFMHNSMPYYDLLLQNLRLRTWRKG